MKFREYKNKSDKIMKTKGLSVVERAKKLDKLSKKYYSKSNKKDRLPW